MRFLDRVCLPSGHRRHCPRAAFLRLFHRPDAGGFGVPFQALIREQPNLILCHPLRFPYLNHQWC